jgi:hypothetical protein
VIQSPRNTLAKAPWVLKVALITAPLVIVFLSISNAPFFTHAKFGGHIVGRDFLNYWTGSKLFLSGRLGTLYDAVAYPAYLDSVWGNGFGSLSFSYPPTLLPFISWLGLFPYGVALVLWSVLGVGLLIAAGWPYTKQPLVLLALIFAPAVCVCLDDGQNGLIFSAMLVAALRVLDRKPILAGVLIGLLTVKPQLGILLPIALICAGRWKTVGAAAVTTLALVALSLLIAGAEPWRLYFEKVVPYQSRLFRGDGMWQTMTPSPVIAIVVAHGSWALAWAVQAAVSAAMMVLVAVLFLGRGNGRSIGAVDRVILTGATFLATPYAFNYDMPSLALCLLMAGVTQPQSDATAQGRWGQAILWSAPIAMVMTGLWSVNGAFIVAAGLGLYVWAARTEIFAAGGRPSWLADMLQRASRAAT